MTNEEFLERLQQLSDEHEMSMGEIANLARAIILTEIDPIKATGEEFMFQDQRPRREPFGSNEDDYDLTWINREVPAPDARVDLIEALQQFKSDVDRAQMILNSGTFEDAIRVRENHRAWCQFWAVRHRNPAMRAKFQEFLDATEFEYQRNKARLKRHGYEAR